MDQGEAANAKNSAGIRKLEGSRRLVESNFSFEGWKITVLKSPILPSNCYCDALDEQNSKGISLELQGLLSADAEVKCQVCRFERGLELKHLPEMVFPDNILHLVHEPSGFILRFNTLDAMKMISTQDNHSVRVACAEAWQASKTEMGLPKDIHNDFNWTFTTEYDGTMVGTGGSARTGLKIQADPPETLNLEKLTQREKILFYEELTLFEDELHDHGISNLGVKIRCMPSGFFILLRHFLRVDHVMGKVCDTRIHYEAGNDYFLKQVQMREEVFKNLGTVDPHIYSDINMLYAILPVKRETTEKVFLA